MDRPSIVQCLLQRVEHEAGVRRARHPPAHDPAGIGVDHKGDIDKAGSGRDIGEVGKPEDIRLWRLPPAPRLRAVLAPALPIQASAAMDACEVHDH